MIQEGCILSNLTLRKEGLLLIQNKINKINKSNMKPFIQLLKQPIRDVERKGSSLEAIKWNQKKNLKTVPQTQLIILVSLKRINHLMTELVRIV